MPARVMGKKNENYSGPALAWTVKRIKNRSITGRKADPVIGPATETRTNVR